MNTTNPEAEREMQRIAAEMTALTARRDRLVPVRAGRVADLEAWDRLYATTLMDEGSYQHRRGLLLADIAALDTTDPDSCGSREVADLMANHEPGLPDIERRLARLRAEHAEWQAKATIDPEATATYRYRGSVGSFLRDGRKVQAGEVMEMPRRQYEAFREFFEPVS